MRGNWVKLLAVSLGLSLVVAVLGGCGSKPAAPSQSSQGAAPKKEPIKLGGIFDKTGATGDVGAPYSEGAEDYIKYINSKGGVNGRPVELIGIDYAYKIPQAVEAYKKLVQQDKVVAIMGWGTGDTEAMVPFISQDKEPFISGSYSENLLEIATHPYNFLVAPSYSDQARLVVKWVKDNWKNTSRKPKVAFIYNDTGFGKSPIPDGKKAVQELGLELGSDQIVALTALDSTSQLLNLQKENVDVGIIQETSNATATILKDAKKLGLKTQFIGLNWAADEKVIALAKDAAEGYVGVIPFAFPYEDVPGMKAIQEYNQSAGKSMGSHNQKYVQGWVSAMVMAEGLKRAGDNLSGENIKKGLESLSNFDLGGLAAPVTYTASSHRGAAKAKLYQVKNGKFQPITDYIVAPGR